ncbi:MAG: carbon-nitrogen hydrolase family protein [Candidatus Omnitrophota bacterium]|jgi:predicted amidohydrolase|nr:MAG: carbon-nitrogen hydrolase family protein [Candidatus Omnitrophota bacterium]
MIRFVTLSVIIILNANWTTADEAEKWISDWNPYAQRQALAPNLQVNENTNSLLIKSKGHFRSNGAWQKSFPVREQEFYKIHAEYICQDVELPRRSILVRVDWRNAEGKRVSQPEYPRTRQETNDGHGLIEGIYPAPEGSATALIELIFRWSETGSVEWTNVDWRQSEPPKPRLVKMATVNFRPQKTSGPEENLKQFAVSVREAGEQKADIVCLPEGVTVVGTGKTYLDVAESVPGRSTEFLGELASRYSMYIVAGIYEQDEETVYNTAVLIDRQGKVVGKYRKTTLPREEIEGGITPGDSFPVFATDFGKVGMMICWDVFFPEPARRLAYHGAEIIFMPIWGGNENLFVARAIENQIYLVSSSYSARTGIWDREGKIVAEAKEVGSVVIYEVDLEKKTYWQWLGDFGGRIPREAPKVLEE